MKMLQAKQTKCDGLSVLIIMFPMKIAIKKDGFMRLFGC